jgi:hypothetical protein
MYCQKNSGNLYLVRIQKPVVTYDKVTCDKKAVCSDLFATLPNVFADENFNIFC